jgi:hypothetical protein
MKRKGTKTLEQTYAEAQLAAQKALNVFHAIADDLEIVAHQHAAVAIEADAKVSSLVGLREAASNAADLAAVQADKIRSLVS